MMKDAISSLLKEGNVEGAIELVLPLEDKMLKLELLCYMMEELGEKYKEYPVLLSEAVSLALSPVEDKEKVRALGMLSHALASAGDSEKAEKYMIEALKIAKKIEYPLWKAEALAYVAYYLGMMGTTSDAFYYFNVALETAERSKEQYSAILQVLSLIAELAIEVGDSLNTGEAVDFYSIARDIYTSIKKFVSANEIENKIKLVEDAIKNGSFAVKRAIAEGDIDRAITAVKYLPPEGKAIALLDIAYWLFLHERKDLAKTLLADVYNMFFVEKVRPNDIELIAVAHKFIKIGLLDEALILAGIIQDKNEASKALYEIALGYVRFGKKAKALSIAEGIPNELLREKALKKLGDKNVGYE